MTLTPDDIIKTHGKIVTLRPERVLTFGKFRIQNADDFEVQISRPYYIKGLIHPGELSVWYGEPGCGKTFLLQHMAYAIAQGREVMGRRVHGCSALFFEMEGGGFYRRLEALRRQFGACDQFHFATQSVSLFANEAAIGDVVAAAKMTKAGLVVIDTLSRAMAGGNENAPDDMGKFVSILDSIREATGAAVALVHHSGKNQAMGARGHNSLKGAVDVEGEISKCEDGERQLKIIKARDDADGEAMPFRLNVVELGVDVDGDKVTTCIVEQGTESGFSRRPSGKKLSAQNRQAFDCLKEAIDEHGQQNVPGLKPQISAIRRRTWLEVATKRMLGTSEAATDKALTRAVHALRDTKMIGTSEPWIWIIAR